MMIFVSHSSNDKALARQIKQELECRHLQVWLDEANIRVGQSIPDEIATAIARCNLFCILISKKSVSSSWVMRELNCFIANWLSGKAALVPCMVDVVDMPTIINDIKYANFSSSFQEGLEGLLNAVYIREEVEFQNELQESRQTLLSALSPPDLGWFVHYFSRTEWYVIGDTRDARWPSALHHLEEVGAVELDADRYERLYSLTEKGRKLLKIMKNDAPQDLLAQWDLRYPLGQEAAALAGFKTFKK